MSRRTLPFLLAALLLALLAAMQDEVVAVLRQAQRDRAADAAAGPGDQHRRTHTFSPFKKALGSWGPNTVSCALASSMPSAWMRQSNWPRPLSAW